jgi:hypothetical protein
MRTDAETSAVMFYRSQPDLASLLSIPSQPACRRCRGGCSLVELVELVEPVERVAWRVVGRSSASLSCTMDGERVALILCAENRPRPEYPGAVNPTSFTKKICRPHRAFQLPAFQPMGGASII